MTNLNKPYASTIKEKDLLDLHKKDIFLSLNCHAIGIIEKFNSVQQTAMVKMSYSKTFLDTNERGETLTKIVDYPILVDCPVVVLCGGTSGITMPIAKGDSCLILFSDRDIDNWFSGAKTGPLNSNRLHSLSDAIVLVGLRPKGSFVSDYDSVNPTIFNGETRIKIKSSKILIENSDDKLGLLLSELIDTIKSIQTTNAVVGVPCAIGAASQTALDVVKAKFEGLLE